jgi:hypothetical protein
MSNTDTIEAVEEVIERTDFIPSRDLVPPPFDPKAFFVDVAESDRYTFTINGEHFDHNSPNLEDTKRQASIFAQNLEKGFHRVVIFKKEGLFLEFDVHQENGDFAPRNHHDHTNRYAHLDTDWWKTKP